MSIVSDAEFTAYLQNETGTQDENMIAAAHATAEEAVIRYCGGRGWRTFETTATSPTARSYGPTQLRDSGTVVRVHDFCSTTGLIVSNYGSIMDAATYQLEPINGFSVTGEPYQQIRLLYGNRWYQYGMQSTVTITAKWGWDSPPARAVEAVKLIGKDYVTARGSKFGFVESSVGPVRGGRNWLALNALANLRRVEAFGIST